MAKKPKTPAEASAEQKDTNLVNKTDDKGNLTPAAQRAYVVAVIKKQVGVSLGEATKRAADLSADVHDALHDAGREGRVAECRELLGL